MKANFKGANLHFANLKNCNLLGTNFEHARLENVIWDKEILQHVIVLDLCTLKGV
jgi:uncharacterized protein YjbI with pentapeptide repeats